MCKGYAFHFEVTDIYRQVLQSQKLTLSFRTKLAETTPFLVTQCENQHYYEISFGTLLRYAENQIGFLMLNCGLS